MMNTKIVRATWGLLAWALAFGISSATAAPSMSEAIRQGGTASGETPKGLALLRQSGAEFASILVAERLPDSSSYLVEAAFDWRGHRLRYPLELERTDETGWQIRWSPVATYAEALLRRFGQRQLPETSREQSGAQPWAERRTVPALPVVATSERLVTPFGRLSLEGGGGLSAPKGFKRHLKRWVRGLSNSDEAGAALDLIATRDVSWRHITRLLLASAGFGYFRIHLVMYEPDEGRLMSESYLAPVSFEKTSGSPASSLVVGLYRIAPSYQFRISIGEELVSGDEACESERNDGRMSLCLSTLDGFSKGVRTLLESRGRRLDVSRVVFASTGSLTLERVVPVLHRLPASLQIPSDRLMLGHIRAPSRRSPSPTP